MINTSASGLNGSFDFGIQYRQRQSMTKNMIRVIIPMSSTTVKSRS